MTDACRDRRDLPAPVAPPAPRDRLDPPGLLPAFMPPPSLRYRRAAVRDLAWLVLDGALQLPVDAGELSTVRLDGAENAEFLTLLQDWDDDPHDSWLGPVDPRLRLGLYAERLIGAWLRQSRLIGLVAMNWRLRANRITLGEADFLVSRQGRCGVELQLWELACKYYLRVPGRGWVGPGLNDSLAAKLARVRGHQLQLIHQPGFRAAWHGAWSARAWMAGWLLESAVSLADASDGGPCAGDRREPGRVAGVWAEARSHSAAVADAHARRSGVTQWWLLPKRRWLRPAYADEPVAQRFADLDQAASFLTAPLASRETGGEPRPLMLAGIRCLPVRSAPAVAVEALRVMLVPPGWSERAARLPVEMPGGAMPAPGTPVTT